MKKGWLAIVIVIFLIAGIIIYSQSVNNNQNVNVTNDAYYCTSDSDCMPEQACHPTSCINKKFESNKKGTFCTQVCEPGTLDCGQGSCICENNKCKVKFNE